MMKFSIASLVVLSLSQQPAPPRTAGAATGTDAAPGSAAVRGRG